MLTVNKTSKIMLERDKTLRVVMVDKFKEEDAKSLLKSAFGCARQSEGRAKEQQGGIDV